VGRSYAKLYRDIWSDPDFTALGPETRYVYMFLTSQPDLNAAGVLPLTIRRWATSADLTTDALNTDLELLDERRYVVIDNDTEELLIRTFVRNDGLWRIPNTLYAVLRDAGQVASPRLRLALAAELALLPVDELDGKRAAVMKAQLSTVTATLGSTVSPTVRSTVRQGLRQLFAQPLSQHKAQPVGAGVGEGGGTGGSSNKDVDDQSSDRNARAPARENGACDDDLIDLIIAELRKATGKDVTREWAAKTHDHILAGRATSNPGAYIRSAIRNEPDPRKRFLPLY